MKKALEIIGIFIISVIYCHTSAVSFAFASFDFAPEKNYGKNSFFLSAEIGFGSSALEPQNYLNFLNTSLPSGKKSSPPCFSIINGVTELLILSNFSRYHFLSENFPVRYRKANLIFPSHYFL